MPDQPILRYFEFDHLPEGEPRNVSYLCCSLAHTLAENLEPSAELSAGLRHLLEAKDCFVRAALPR